MQFIESSDKNGNIKLCDLDGNIIVESCNFTRNILSFNPYLIQEGLINLSNNLGVYKAIKIDNNYFINNYIFIINNKLYSDYSFVEDSLISDSYTCIQYDYSSKLKTPINIRVIQKNNNDNGMETKFLKGEKEINLFKRTYYNDIYHISVKILEIIKSPIEEWDNILKEYLVTNMYDNNDKLIYDKVNSKVLFKK